MVIIYLGIIDAWKYLRLRQKIVRNKSSRNVSRLFGLSAFLCDIGFVAYTILILDPVLMVVRGLALYTTMDLYFHCYLFYPFKRRKLKGFKRPSLFTFILNTLEPNSSRKRL